MFSIKALKKLIKREGTQDVLYEYFGYSDRSSLSDKKLKEKSFPAYRVGLFLDYLAREKKPGQFIEDISEIFQLSIHLFGKADQAQRIKDLEKEVEGLKNQNNLLNDKANLLEENKKYLKKEIKRIKIEIVKLKQIKRKDDPEDFDPSKLKRSICKIVS